MVSEKHLDRRAGDPGRGGQDVCDQLVAAGVTAILNFAPTVLSVPAHVDVRKVDLAAELQILSFHEKRKAGRSAHRAMPRSPGEVADMTPARVGLSPPLGAGVGPRAARASPRPSSTKLLDEL